MPVMNKKFWICLLAVAMLLALAGCREDQVDAPAADVTEPVVVETTVPEETTEPEEETIPLPEGEGVESIDKLPGGEENVSENTKPQDSTKPTEAKPSESKPSEAPDATEPAQTETQPAQPEEPTAPPATEAPTAPPATSTSCGCAYQQFLNMSAVEQEAYMNSFESPLAFIEWAKQAKIEHEAHDTSIKVEGGDLNIGDFINP